MEFLALLNFYLNVPCGKCISCLKRKFNNYRMRLLYELNEHPNSIFVTLTFDNPSLSKFADNPNKSLSLFLDRIRKKYGKQVRHWFVAEYGKKHGRLHYHGILFDIDIGNDELFQLWKYGNTFVGYANEITAKYIVKYLTKDDTKGISIPPRVITSFGIGDSFLTSPQCDLLKSQLATAITINGFKVPLPRYYLDKMYNEREKEIISYYLYCESDFTYWVAGKEYDTEKQAKYARGFLYRDYKSKGLIFDNYVKRSRIGNDIKTLLHFDSYFQNYGKF